MNKPLHILYVEDEANLEAVVRLYLEKEGLSVKLQRVSTRSSLEYAISSSTYDLYIIDRLLDDFDGFEAIQLIRQAGIKTPIIMLSGTLDEALIVKALHNGATDYLFKQNIARIGSVVKQVINEYLSAQTPKQTNSADLSQDAIAQLLPGGIYQFKRSKEGHYSLPRVNTQFEQLLGINESQVQEDAAPAFEKIHPDDMAGLMSSIEHSAMNLEKWEYDFRVRKDHGDYHWLKAISEPRRQDDGSIIWSGILLDINRHKQTEAALRSSETSTLAILDNLVDTYYRTDDSGHILLVSPSVSHLLGYHPDELLGKKLADLYAEPDGREKFLKALNAANGVLSGYEAALKHKHGHTVWVSTSSRYYNKDGAIAGVEGTTRDITAHRNKDIQQHVEDNMSHELLDLITNHMPAILYNIKIEGQEFKTQWVSKNIYDLLGYSYLEVVTEDWWQKHIHPDDRDKALANMQILFDTGNLTHEYRFLCANGEYKWILDRLVLVKDQSGSATHINGSWVDVTDRRDMENALRTSEERFRRSQAFANIGTWDWNIKTGDLYWSERIAPLFGYPLGNLETTYDNFLAAVHPDDRQAVIDAVNACVESGAEYNIEHRCVWPDGSVRWLLEKGDVIRANDGSPLHMLGVVQDITVRKQAELELAEHQSKLGALYELSPLGIALTDMNGKYLEFNEAFQKITGYPAEELNTLDYWTLTPREYEQQEIQQLASLNDTGRYGPYEKVYRQKNGRLVPIRLNGILVTSKEGEQQIWSIVEDITDSKETEEALIAAKEMAEHANQAKSEFLSSMSHELRTPLNAIIGFSQLLETEPDIKPDQQENVHEIYKAGTHLLELINEILDLSKIESGRMELHIEDINLNQVVEESVQLNKTLADSKGVSLQLDSSSIPPQLLVSADRTRLKQVVINLLSNAIKYNRDNGKVFVSCVMLDNNKVKLRVQDTGYGIPEDKLDELFIPFKRLGAENSSIEGTGIGLVITRNLVEQMGGMLEIESKINQGSTFSVTLTYTSGSEAVTPATSSNNNDKMNTAMSSKKTIIYIEDNPTNLKLVQQLMLRKKDVQLLSAMEPRAGIDLINQHHPNLILLDINLPGMSGFDVLEILKSNPETRDIPVLAISANAMASDIEKGQQAGFVDYITKPIDIQDFYAKLDQYIS